MSDYLLLDEIEESGEYLNLMDGSRWWLNPGDISISISWSPTARIHVEKVDESTFPYRLTNLENNSYIRARKVS